MAMHSRNYFVASKPLYSEEPVVKVTTGVSRPRKAETKFMANGGIPIDVNGTIALPNMGYREHVAKFLEHRSISDELLLDHLNEYFFKFIGAICSQDEEKIRAMAEPHFAEKLIKNSQKAKSNDMKFERGSNLVEATPDSTDYGDLRGNLVSDA